MKAILTGLMLVLVVSACSAKITSDAPAAPRAKPFTDEVTGPNLDGTWKSGCERDKWSNGFVIFDVVVNNRKIVRTETKYVDVNCTQKIDVVVGDGDFRYMVNHGTDIYEVEYRFKMTNGYYLSKDNVRRIGAKLWISDRVVGQTVTPDIQLNLVH